ncbi:MAG: WYL domain-containing protein [Burkholderiales bacterium]|nr:WYL domain-containing protein [Burkholderiales bacterium]
MSEFIRLSRYSTLLSPNRAVTIQQLMAALEVSKATVKRDIAKLKYQGQMPIRHDRDRGGYVLDKTDDARQVPGLWFHPDEILSLLTLQHLLSQLEPGLLGPKLKPLQERLADMLKMYGLSAEEVKNRLRIVHAGKRALPPPLFEAVAAATMQRKRLRITHMRRETGEVLTRDISPQRMVHYRDNWYVDAWCHLRDDLRSFSLDAVSEAHALEEGAKEVEPGVIDERLGAGYGIFGGKPKAWATLRFTPERARWVKGEMWHPQQKTRDGEDGSYEVSVPYSDDREILGDILRFGAGVEVVAPADLRKKIHSASLATASRYV